MAKSSRWVYIDKGPTPKGHEGPRDGLCYFEGESPQLALSDEGPSGWFSFEETWANGCAELTKLGFTVQQVMVSVEESRIYEEQLLERGSIAYRDHVALLGHREA